MSIYKKKVCITRKKYKLSIGIRFKSKIVSSFKFENALSSIVSILQLVIRNV